MRLFEAEPALVADLRGECELVETRTRAGVEVLTLRHPTLGRLVLVITPEGGGIVAEFGD
ncbi:hypothetical protein MARPU_11995 [Marichromatium purpuratum 984]|uniref:Glyoxalase n=2 Tax=Marichromatium TaxID=85076 RepID=W0E0S2_MARPU|nr:MULTISPECIES: hypothetical protein [Marichromatium]AHF04485.1 hypothetical protein MARPU_11995 [Marichromatium purpuratum 984]MBK1709755.1 hypothetical protein [Marichromatium gracile]RNE91267.1 hypothetical protein EBL84_04425 [Marichromatium sp. AB31]RNE92946.1 hypothetical protein EBL85_09290 [Marichromatium sp. AB32]TCW33280.1 hypothetical protein EDC29_11530 [Marichromatium gracile]